MEYIHTIGTIVKFSAEIADILKTNPFPCSCVSFLILKDIIILYYKDHIIHSKSDTINSHQRLTLSLKSNDLLHFKNALKRTSSDKLYELYNGQLGYQCISRSLKIKIKK